MGWFDSGIGRVTGLSGLASWRLLPIATRTAIPAAAVVPAGGKDRREARDGDAGRAGALEELAAVEWTSPLLRVLRHRMRPLGSVMNRSPRYPERSVPAGPRSVTCGQRRDPAS